MKQMKIEKLIEGIGNSFRNNIDGEYKNFINESKDLLLEFLPSNDEASVIALKIIETDELINVQEQAMFLAGFIECVKYLKQEINQ